MVVLNTLLPLQLALSRSPLATTPENLHRRQNIELRDSSPTSLFVFTGNLSLGTPAQSFNVLFDSGSFVLWLRDVSCKSAQCSGLAAFDSTKSASFLGSEIQQPTIKYADGTNVDGVLSMETFAFKNWTVPGQQFVRATAFSQRMPEIDGIMGLGFPTRLDNFISVTHQCSTKRY